MLTAYRDIKRRVFTSFVERVGEPCRINAFLCGKQKLVNTRLFIAWYAVSIRTGLFGVVVQIPSSTIKSEQNIAYFSARLSLTSGPPIFTPSKYFLSSTASRALGNYTLPSHQLLVIFRPCTSSFTSKVTQSSHHRTRITARTVFKFVMANNLFSDF